MAGDKQLSSAQATRNGILALSEAGSMIERSRQDVGATKDGLSAAYRGGDGRLYGELLRKRS